MPQNKVGQPPEELKPLPGAETEAKNIATLLNTQPLIGGQATETAVVERMGDADLIHLATHGLLDDINGVGAPGAIVLSPSSEDDGFLTTDEIMKQFALSDKQLLNADLIVLSACDTGGGKVTGDGVVGLSRSLIAAGAPSIIVSLWKVPDRATQALMTAFYTNLYEKKMDKATALRQAMLGMIEGENPGPAAWAGFTLMGEAM